MASWPYSPKECPRCQYFEPVDPPALDGNGYEIVGGCLHPRIAMYLLVIQERDPDTLGRCPCFWAKAAASDRDP